MGTSIGVRELKNRATSIVRRVREERAEYIVTYRGEPVAVLRPLTDDEARRVRAARMAEGLDDLDRLADEVSAAWLSEESAVENLVRQRDERCP
jgi:prevent-host-death family protein